MTGEKTFYRTWDARNGTSDIFETYERAEESAKRIVAAKPTYPVEILQAIAKVQAPVPAAEVTKLS